jgi:hypothetical protein
VGTNGPRRHHGKAGQRTRSPVGGDGAPGQRAERDAYRHRRATGRRIPRHRAPLPRWPPGRGQLRGRTTRRARRHHDRAPRANRRGRRDRPVELPADPGLVQIRARPDRGVHHRAEALTRNGAGRVPVRGGRRGRRHPAWCDQHRPGRPGDRRLPGPAPRRGQGRLHRLHRRGPAHRGNLRPPAPPGDPGTGRQVGRDRPRRRRPRPGQDRQRPVRGHSAQQRADLLPRHPGTRPPLAVRRGRRHPGRVRLVAGRG